STADSSKSMRHLLTRTVGTPRRARRARDGFPLRRSPARPGSPQTGARLPGPSSPGSAPAPLAVLRGEARMLRAPTSHEEAAMVQAGAVREGMTVRTSDGRKVGRAAAIGDVHFELEKGLVPIPRRDYLVEYRD